MSYGNHFVLGFLGDAVGVANVLIKSTLGVTLMIWVRWTLPRLRIDQVITTCLKYCVPISAVCFVGAIGWVLLELPSPNVINRAEVREGWAQRMMVSSHQTPRDEQESETIANSYNAPRRLTSEKPRPIVW